ncbi:MAG TPA: PilZ domain-containing protein, partial [Phycisphaerae bacterium]|nr:PilZ domain-containing protein [Phycisphaerae bacterium]
VELWVPDDNGDEAYLHARALNLSPLGLGILADEDLPIGRRVSVAIHQPEATLFGEAIIRHASPTTEGRLVGLQFLY